jgi:hypothetical protein
LGTGTGKGTKVAAQPQSQRQYVKDVFYVNLSQNRRKVKVKGVYVDVINIYVRISSADGQNLDTKRRWDYGNVHQVHIIIWIMTALEID